jgi:hypothetical protein
MSAPPRAAALNRHLPPDVPLTILVGAYPASTVRVDNQVRALTEWLEMSGYPVYYADVDLGQKGRWQRVLAGAYTDPQVAQREADRLNAVVPGAGAQVIEAAFASDPGK